MIDLLHLPSELARQLVRRPLSPELREGDRGSWLRRGRSCPTRLRRFMVRGRGRSHRPVARAHARDTPRAHGSFPQPSKPPTAWPAVLSTAGCLVAWQASGGHRIPGLKKPNSRVITGGEKGIRTPGELAPTPD